MPVEFLSEEQKQNYAQFSYELSPEELSKYFMLDDNDKINIFGSNEKHNQLGFALQLTTVRFLGTFLANPTHIPKSVVNYISQQINIDSEKILLYTAKKTIWNHKKEICNLYGYTEFHEPFHWRFVRWLYSCFWYTNERPSTIFEKAVSKCLSLKILLPGITTLERLVSQVKERASSYLWRRLSVLPDKKQCAKLENLLKSVENKHYSKLESIRKQITYESPIGFLKTIERYNKIYSLEAYKWDISKIPLGKIRVLARYASTAKATAIRRMPHERKIATLASFAIIFTISSRDNVIDYMLKYFTELFNKVERSTKKERLRTLKDLDKSANKLSKVCKLLLDRNIPDNEVRNLVLSDFSEEELSEAIETVDTLTKPSEQDLEYMNVFKYYSSVRRFLPNLLASIKFKSVSAGKNTLLAWNFLASAENKSGKNKYKDAPTDGMTQSWKNIIFKNDTLKPCPYTFWVIENMVKGIKKFDIFIENSDKFSDPRSNLIQPEEWVSKKQTILGTLRWSANPKESLEPLKVELNTVYKNTVENWESNPDVRVDEKNGKPKVIITNIDKLEEPKSLIVLKKRIHSLLPDVDLPQILLEIATLTKFTEQFTHISQNNSRVDNLHISICAVLVAKACNIGIKAVSQRGIPALEYDRLVWVEQNYFRNETLVLTNQVLVEYYRQVLYLSQFWGTGDVVSADGLRYLTPPKTIYSGANSNYFGRGRGLTSNNLISDLLIGLNINVVTGTLRDSMGLLELVLGQSTIIKPREVMTDTAGYSDMIFGLFALLGYKFSPRISDMGSSKLWRFDKDKNYGILNNLSKGKIKEDLILKYWDDMLRVAGSLSLGTINPTNLIQMLQRSGRPTMLGKALMEFGRIFKTTHHLTLMDDKDHRRRLLTQLNMGESAHSLKRDIFYWKKGQLYQTTREGQEDQLWALEVVANAIIIWNTIYMQKALEYMEQAGYIVEDNDKARLKPFIHDHINIIGNYSFEETERSQKGILRNLLPMNEQLFGKI